MASSTVMRTVVSNELSAPPPLIAINGHDMTAIAGEATETV